MEEELKHDKLWVVAVVSNPIRFASRYRLFKNFIKHMKDHNVNLCVVEEAFGDRPFELENEVGIDIYVKVRSFDELWHKENLISLGVSRLPYDWEYLAWLDGDIEFTRKNWASECVHILQHYMFCQLFQTAIHFGPNEEVLKVHNGFAYNYQRGIYDVGMYGSGYGYVGHPGFAWACRREAWDAIGGFSEADTAILGSGDHHLAMAIIGRVKNSWPQNVTKGYKTPWLHVQSLSESYIKRDVGFMQGSILHYWHGKIKDRRYADRWKILSDNEFDPRFDLKRDSQGLWQLAGNKPKLRDDIRAYFRARAEDSIDMEIT